MFLLAVGTFQTQGNLLGSLSLLVENGLGLSTKTRLLTVITSLTLSEKGVLSLLILGDLLLSVLVAVLTVSLTRFRNNHLRRRTC